MTTQTVTNYIKKLTVEYFVMKSVKACIQQERGKLEGCPPSRNTV